MPTWGANTNKESMPNWLTAEEKERCYATKAGWVLRHPNNRADGTIVSTKEELLVAIRGLSQATNTADGLGIARLGAASPVGLKWTGSSVVGASSSLKVTFNEKVTVTAGATILVTKSTGGTLTATYASINADKTVATFTFTNPAACTMTVAAQTISGTIVEVDGGAAADMAITSAVATALVGKAVA